MQGRRKFPVLYTCQICGKVDETFACKAVLYCSNRCREKARYSKDREKRLQGVRDYRKKYPERAKKTSRNSRDKRKEYHILRSREYYAKNREAMIAYALEYQKRNPGVVSRRNARIRAKVSFEVTARDHARLLDRFRGECAYCGVVLTEPSVSVDTGLQWEHPVPLSRGGVNGVGNLLPCCKSCNSSKGNMFYMEWRMSKMKKKENK